MQTIFFDRTINYGIIPESGMRKRQFVGQINLRKSSVTFQQVDIW